ncbi:MAG: GNAT family N-acetyltransferase [Rhodospirillaceae bacterium]|jgi:hypothetical protein|nr:GNAT family N-acetyltransferase [Rhodospirillaceae bacterium]MBT6116841.1 GNAT family N-acetyltransferase [Rhodospirillaceae bacterium]
METCGDPNALAKLYAVGGFARALASDEGVVAAGGLFVLRPGVAEAWLIRSVDLSAHRISTARWIRRGVEEGIARLRLHRVQAAVRKDDSKACRLAEWLGFVSEGVMRRHGPDGSDSILFARTENMGDFFSNVLPAIAYGAEGLNARQERDRTALQAQLAHQATARVQQQNSQEEKNARRRANEAYASRRARFGAAGVALEGSPLLALADLSEDSRGELSALTLRNQSRADVAHGHSLLADQRVVQANEHLTYLPYFEARRRAEQSAMKSR